jgi:hypothetical protein
LLQFHSINDEILPNFIKEKHQPIKGGNGNKGTTYVPTSSPIASSRSNNKMSGKSKKTCITYKGFLGNNGLSYYYLILLLLEME